MPAITQQTTTFPITHQGVRDLNQTKHPVLPISGRATTPKPPRINVGETERMFSAAGGALLVGFGLGQGSLMGVGLALAGGALLYRGIGGHCALYASMGINTADAPRPGTRTEKAYHVQ